MKKTLHSKKIKSLKAGLPALAVTLFFLFSFSQPVLSQLSAGIDGTTTVCLMDPEPVVTFTGQGGTEPYTFTYTLNGGSEQTITSTGATALLPVSTASEGSFEYVLLSVTDFDMNIVPASGTVTVTVNPIAGVASVNGPSPLCIGAGGFYTASSVVLGGGTGSWSSSNEAVATVNPATGEVSALSAGTADITYTISGGCGGTKSASMLITVNPNASVASVTGASPLCTGSNAIFTANSVVLGGGTGSWSSSNEAVATVNTATGEVSALSAGTADITYTISGGCGGVTSASMLLTVNPDATITLTSPGSTNMQTVCINTPVTNIVYSVGGGGSGAGVSGLPSGVTGLFADGTFTISGKPLVTGTYSYTVTTTGVCDQAIATGSIKVNPDATIVLTSASQTTIQGICINTELAPITYSVGGGGTGAEVTGLPAGTSGVFSGGLVTISGTPSEAGLFTYNVTTTGTCLQTSSSGTITVYSIPTASISGSAEVCKGSPSPEILFTGASGVSPYTFTYTINGGSPRTISTAAGSNTVTLIVPTSAAATFTYDLVSVKDASSAGCSQLQSGTAVVIVNPLPAATISGTTAVCQGSSSPTVVFSGSSGTPPYTFTYTVNSGDPVTISTVGGNSSVSLEVPTTTAGIFTYSLVNISDASTTYCSQPASGSATVTVRALPSPPVAGTITQPTCLLSTGSVTLTGLPSGSWTLTMTPGDVNTSGSGSTFTISGLSAGVYSFTVTNSQGCVSLPSDEITIADQPPSPLLVITNPAAVCSPLTVDITSVAITEGSTPGLAFTYWTDAAATKVYNTPTATTAGTYYIKGTNTFNCYDIKPVVVTVNQTPAANAGAGGNECDLTFVFKAVPSIGAGTWTMTSGPGEAVFSPSATSPTATVTVSSYGTYTFTWTEVNGDCVNSNSVTVNFYEQPVVSAGPGGNNCGLEFYLDGSMSVGTGTWSLVSGTGNAVFTPDANAPNALVTVSDYGNYSFRWSVTNGTCTATSTVTVKFIKQPAADAGTGGSECDLSFVLGAVPGSGTGLWKVVNGPGTALFTPSASDPAATVTVDKYGTYSLSWTETNSVCKSTDYISVSFHETPAVSAGEDINICSGSQATLSATGTGSFSWQPDTLVNNPFIYNPIASPVETTVFKVTLTDQYGCVNSDEVEVAVWDQPIADAGRDTTLEYIFQTTMRGQLGLNQTGQWSVVSGSANFADPNDPETGVTGLSLNRNELAWTVTNGVCPESTDKVIVTVNDLLLPTLITPNGDNMNEYLVFRGLESLGKTRLLVFDRNGRMVFENNDYRNDWNGIDNSGRELPEDTYFIVLKAENGKSLSNFIVIRR